MQLIETRLGEKRWVGLSGYPGKSGIVWTELRLLARVEGYVMVRSDGQAPFVIEEAEWADLPPVIPTS